MDYSRSGISATAWSLLQCHDDFPSNLKALCFVILSAALRLVDEQDQELSCPVSFRKAYKYMELSQQERAKPSSSCW